MMMSILSMNITVFMAITAHTKACHGFLKSTGNKLILELRKKILNLNEI